MNDSNKQMFLDHLEKAAKVVSTWPKWKQEVLGGTAEEVRLTRKQMLELFQAKNANHELREYKKKGTFLIRRASRPETVLTIVAGKLETIKSAQPGDIIIRNINLDSWAEKYIISAEKFEQRYKRTGNSCYMDGEYWAYAEAKGEIEAFEWDGPQFVFEAPWGENMVCKPGDFIGRPPCLPGDPIEKQMDIYRVEKETFEQTYGSKDV